MNKLSKEKKERLMMVCLAVGGILAILYFFVISSQEESLAASRSKSDSLRSKLDKAKKLGAQKEAIDERLARSQAMIDAKQKNMAQPGNYYYWCFRLLERATTPYDVTLVTVQNMPEIGEVKMFPSFPYKTATFQISLSCRYQNFGRFLAEFENAYPYMRIQNVSMSPEGSGRGRSAANQAVGPARTGANDGLEAGGEVNEKLSVTFQLVTLIKPTT